MENKEIIQKIKEYEIESDMIDDICKFYEERGFITDKQKAVLHREINDYEDAGGMTYGEVRGSEFF